MISGGRHSTLILWDIESGEEIRSFEEDSRGPIAITPDGKYVISRDCYRNLILWEIEGGKAIRRFGEDNYGSVESVEITADGKYVISGSSDKTMKLWEIDTGEEIRSFEGHNDSIQAIVITSDGKYVISGSLDKTIKLWEIESGKELIQYVSFEDAEWVSSTKDDYFNCSASAYKYFSFLDENIGMPKVVDRSHPIYKKRKLENLLDRK